MESSKNILVVGAGGFIGGHLINRLLSNGNSIVACDIKPKGVRGRSSNNDLVKKVLNWSYNIKLKDGLAKTYNWISSEMDKEGANISRFTKS